MNPTLLVCILLSFQISAHSEAREWTQVGTNRKLSGELLSASESSLTIMNEKGLKVEIPIAMLADSDRQFLKEWRVEKSAINKSEPDDSSSKVIPLKQMPDLLQTDERGSFAGNGNNFCAPVSVSNSLIYLSRTEFPEILNGPSDSILDQYSMVNLLASKDYFDTDLKIGTGVSGVVNGTNKFLEERGCKIKCLEYQGWRRHPEEFSSGETVPNLDWIREGLINGGAIWLNLGWYKRIDDTPDFERVGGHWVTLSGFGVRRNGEKDPSSLVVNDPSPGSGSKPSSQYCTVLEIKNGELTGEKAGLPRSAKGFFELGGEFNVSSRADVAIIDGVVRLEIR